MEIYPVLGDIVQGTRSYPEFGDLVNIDTKYEIVEIQERGDIIGKILNNSIYSYLVGQTAWLSNVWFTRKDIIIIKKYSNITNLSKLINKIYVEEKEKNK